MKNSPLAPLMIVVVLVGMQSKLVGQNDLQANTKTVAVLIFDGVELLDFTGPAEVFIVAEHGKAFRVLTVSEGGNPIRTMGGIQVTPDFSVSDIPQADIIVVPGGGMSHVGQSGREWLKTAAANAEVVMSVCMGAFLLADAGLLDGVRATTHRWGIASLKRAAPKCEVVSGERFVDSGKIITTAGVTAGIDGALHIVKRVCGEESARWTAEQWMEYTLPGTHSPTPSSKDAEPSE